MDAYDWEWDATVEILDDIDFNGVVKLVVEIYNRGPYDTHILEYYADEEFIGAYQTLEQAQTKWKRMSGQEDCPF